MTSIHTNSAAMSALAIMRSTNSDLDRQQDVVSSGYRVATASDGAAYWSIGTTMRSENKALASVGDSISLSHAIVDTAYNGLDTAMGYMESIRDIFITAKSMPASAEDDFENLWPNGVIGDKYFSKTDLGKLDHSINELLAGATAAIKASSFSGVNLLYNSDLSVGIEQSGKSLVIGYQKGDIRTLVTDPLKTTLFSDEHQDHLMGSYCEDTGLLDSSMQFSLEGTFHTHGMTFFNSVFGSGVQYLSESANVNPNPLLKLEKEIVKWGADRGATYDNAINAIEGKLDGMRDGMAYLGSVQNALDTYDELNAKWQDNYDRGVGRLVDADMEEASSRLGALQTQQQLAIQSLNIANSQFDTVLQLFN
jgi:flagellin